MIQIKRGNSTIVEVIPLSSSNITRAVMGEEKITMVYEAAEYTELLLGDYIMYEGAKWTLNALPTVKKISTNQWRIDTVFESTQYDLSKVMYLLFDSANVPPKGEFSLTGQAELFLELLVANLNRIAGTGVWRVGDVIEDTPFVTLTFSNESCFAVLGRLADEFDTEYHINGNIINLVRKSTERHITLEYGSNLYDVERSSVDSTALCTRLYPCGSTKNLPTDYRGGNMPLCLPESEGQYIEKNTALYGIIEQSKTFDTIFPRLELLGAGVVTAVGNHLQFSDNQLNFDVNEYLMAGTPAKVHFNTGQCAGYEFEIKQYNNISKQFTIIVNTSENDFTLPTAALKPAIGDKYVLLDIIMPEAYRTAAEQELLTKATEWMADYAHPHVGYKCTFSQIVAKQNIQVLECGDMVRLVDAELGIDEQIRIVKLTKGLTDYWNLQIDLANTVTKTTLERINGDITTIQHDVVVSNERINRNSLRTYQQSKELRDMVFDADGYFDTGNIKPLSIETAMLSVGAKSQSFQLSTLLKPNYGGNANVLQWSAGVLAHFTIVDDAITQWVIPAGSITLVEGNTTVAQYIYAKCSRTGSTGVIYLSAKALKFDSASDYWYFLLGVLHTPIEGVRGVSLTYGQTTINGQFITTGVIKSIDGATYFNLNTGEIGGKIKFRSTNGTEKSVADAITETYQYVDNIEIGGRNLLLNTKLDSRTNWSSLPVIMTDSTNSINYVQIYNVWTKYASQLVKVENGSEYTLSALVRCAAPTTISWKLDTQNKESKINIDNTQWARVVIGTIKSTASQLESVAILTRDAKIIDIAHIMLEKGNKATDWTPAPDDVDASVAMAQTTANEATVLAAKEVSNANLLQNSYVGSITIEAGSFKIFTTSKKLKSDTYYTTILDVTAPTGGLILLGSDYRSGGVIPNETNGIVVVKGKETRPFNHNTIGIRNTGNQAITLRWMCSYEGDVKVPTKWIPSAFELPTIYDNLLINSMQRIVVGSSTENYAFLRLCKLSNNMLYTFSANVVTSNGTNCNIRLWDFVANAGVGSIAVFPSGQRSSFTFVTPNTGDLTLLIYAGTIGETANVTATYTKLMLQNYNESTAWKLENKTMQEAIQGTTEIEGGLVLGNMLGVKNSAGELVGGINGLESSDVSFWGGGTFEEAQSAMTGNGKLPILLTKNGWGSNIGIFNIDEDSIVVDNGGRKVYITTKKISEIPTVSAPITLGTIEKTLIPGTWKIAPSGSFVLNVSGVLGSASTSGGGTLGKPAGGITAYGFAYLTINGVRTLIGGGYGSPCTIQYPLDGVGNVTRSNSLTITVNTAIINKVLSSTGSAKIEFVTEKIESGNVISGTTSVSNSTVQAVCKQLKDLTLIAADGFAITKGSSNKFIVEETSAGELKIQFKGVQDIPGVLLAGRAASGGGGVAIWGAKKHADLDVEKLVGSTGTYIVYHSIGHTNYSVQVTPLGAGLSCNVGNLGTTSFYVYIYSGSTLVNANFNFAVYGAN